VIEIHKSADRFQSGTSWLDSRFSFSFADHWDPQRMGFRALRVINEDWIAPAMGFGPHPHQDMEIITYVLEGELEHRDSGGGVGRLGPGRLQLMRAGHGIVHSEMNPSDQTTTHLYQIWIRPERRGLTPAYQEADIDWTSGPLQPIASPHGRDGGLDIRQDVRLHALQLGGGETYRLGLEPDRHMWVQVVRGRGRAAHETVEVGDGLSASNETAVTIASEEGLEALIFDLA
jgi:redox-sensitive bicupin YhaK (pirin superfamily)